MSSVPDDAIISLVVFDMDDTLLGLNSVKLAYEVRPHTVEAILELWNIRNVLVALWSAGTEAYVSNMVDVVLLPAIHVKNPFFFFSRILTYEDTTNGFKDLNKICEVYDVPKERVVLIDDSIEQCNLNIMNGFRAIIVPPFQPESNLIDDRALVGLREKILA